MLTVSDLMTTDPDTVAPDTPLGDVISLMSTQCCRQLPVVDATGRVVGIITDRDVRLAMNSPIVLHGRWQDDELLERATAEACMTPDPISVEPDEAAYRAAEMLSAYKFGALPVVYEGELVGIITRRDIIGTYERAVLKKSLFET